MGEMKHAAYTPGPWIVGAYGYVWPASDIELRDGKWSEKMPHPRIIHAPSPRAASAEADACLIAAAPDLVEALIAARQQLVTLAGDLPDDPTSIIHGDAIQAAVLTVIDAALSKAEGRSLSSASGQEADHG